MFDLSALLQIARVVKAVQSRLRNEPGLADVRPAHVIRSRVVGGGGGGVGSSSQGTGVARHGEGAAYLGIYQGDVKSRVRFP